MVRRCGQMFPDCRRRTQQRVGTAVRLPRQLQRRVAEGDGSSRAHPPEAPGTAGLTSQPPGRLEDVEPPQPMSWYCCGTMCTGLLTDAFRRVRLLAVVQ